MGVLALETVGGFYAFPFPYLLIGPMLGVFIMILRFQHRNDAQMISDLRGIIATQEDTIDSMLRSGVSVPPGYAEAAAAYIKKWQDTEPMTPDAVAAVCAMVVEHLHLTIRDLDDENVATTILTCCSTLDRMRAVAEADQDAIDAATEAWNRMFD